MEEVEAREEVLLLHYVRRFSCESATSKPLIMELGAPLWSRPWLSATVGGGHQDGREGVAEERGLGSHFSNLHGFLHQGAEGSSYASSHATKDLRDLLQQK